MAKNTKQFFNMGTVGAVLAGLGLVGILVWAGSSKVNNNVSSGDDQENATDIHNHSKSGPKTSLNDFVGKSSPTFSFSDRDGNVYSSENLKGKKVVLFFNEGLMCYPACWNQIVSFANDDRLKSGDVTVISVVTDSKEEWQKAVDKMPELAKSTVVFDEGAVVSKKFGVLTVASSMHYGSLPGHSYIVIDKDGMVQFVFDDPKMAIRNDKLVEEINKL